MNAATSLSTLAKRLFPFLLGLTISVSGWAASFTFNEYGALKITGTIQPGDAERAVATLLSIKPIVKNIYLYPSHIYLDSPGGDIEESIKIAAFVKATFMDTVVSPGVNRGCASSCFLIYLAGQNRVASGIEEIARNPVGSLGPLGIHRPYYKIAGGGPKTVEKQERLMDAVMAYLNNERVPRALIEKMMSYPSNEIHWLNSQEIQSLGTYRAGVEEELAQKCNYTAKLERSLSAKEWIRFQKTGVGACVTEYLGNTYGDLKESAFSRMRSGWRPWNR